MYTCLNVCENHYLFLNCILHNRPRHKFSFDVFDRTDLTLLLSAKVNEELEKYSASITGVPYFVVGDKNSQFVNFIFRFNYPSRSIHTIGFSWQINGSQKLSGAQPPEVFLRAFQVV